MANKKAPAPKKVVKKKEEKKIEVQKEFLIVGREIPSGLQKALDDLMKAIEKSDMSNSRKRMAEKIVRTRLSKALAL